MDKIIMLGVGNGGTLDLYNTCFQHDNDNFLVDTGGSIEIIKKLNQANIDYKKIKHIFISHSHTDHILGIFWLFKKLSGLAMHGEINEKINLPDDISAHIRPKTRYTRLGLVVSAQHCNSSYAGTLRIGLFNATGYPIRIRKGYSIAQLVFEELNEVASDEKLYRIKESAHYQNENGEFRGAKFDDNFLDKVMGEILNK